MPINNYDLIAPMMHFEHPGSIYFIQVLRRNKDVGLTGEHWIRDFHVHSMDNFAKCMPEIISLCESNNARAYIRLNVRYIENANLRVVNRIIQCQLAKQIVPAYRLYASVLGESSDEPKRSRKWIVDIDAVPDKTLDDQQAEYIEWIDNHCQPNDGHSKVLAVIPSRTGRHLITRPFNKKDFSEHFGKSECGDDRVMDDGITNLYIPDFKEVH